MITELRAENFKRLKAIQINPDGSPLVIVGGRNGAGKSSTLDAIQAALGGVRTAPDKPIRDGEKRAEIVVETDNLRITRVFTAKGSRLEVKRKEEGAVALSSPQQILDDLVGSLSFDPLAFGRMDPRKQAEVLRGLVGLDFTAATEKRKSLEIDRRNIGRDLRKAKGELERLPAAPVGEAASISEIIAEIEAIDARNRRKDSLRARLSQSYEHYRAWQSSLADVDKKIADLQKERGRVLGEMEKTRQEGEELNAQSQVLEPNESTETLKAQLADAEQHAKLAAASARRDDLEAEVADLEAQHATADEYIQTIDYERAKAIEEAEYPVGGLEVKDEEVWLNGVPWSQASSAEALRASVAIGLALNPKLKILLIRDGSLLDRDSLEIISEMASNKDAQLWVERVGNGDEVTVVIEDGEVIS